METRVINNPRGDERYKEATQERWRLRCPAGHTDMIWVESRSMWRCRTCRNHTRRVVDTKRDETIEVLPRLDGWYSTGRRYANDSAIHAGNECGQRGDHVFAQEIQMRLDDSGSIVPVGDVFPDNWKFCEHKSCKRAFDEFQEQMEDKIPYWVVHASFIDHRKGIVDMEVDSSSYLNTCAEYRRREEQLADVFSREDIDETLQEGKIYHGMNNTYVAVKAMRGISLYVVFADDNRSKRRVTLWSHIHDRNVAEMFWSKHERDIIDALNHDS